MKKRIVGLFLLIVLGMAGGCSVKTELPEKSRNTEGYENYFLYSFTAGQILESEDSYYMIHQGGAGGYFIYTLDKENPMQWLPLCGRPDCSHQDKNCNASISNPAAIGLFDGHLYFCDSNQGASQLWRMELDGSNHEKVKDLYEYSPNTIGNTMIFHKGYLLYELQTVKDGEVAGYELRAVSLKPEEKGYEVIAEAEGMASAGMYPKEEIVYLYLRGEEGIRFCTYNLETKEFLELEQNAQEPVSITIQEKRLILSLRNKGVYRLDMTKKAEEEIIPWNISEEETIYTDEDYLYCGKLNGVAARNKEPGGTMEILDLDGNFLLEVEFPDQALYYSFSTKDHVFFHTVTNFVNDLPSYYIKKEDIEKGTVTFYQTEIE